MGDFVAAAAGSGEEEKGGSHRKRATRHVPSENPEAGWFPEIERRLPPHHPHFRGNHSAVLLSNANVRLLEAAISRLPPRYRVPFILSEVERLPVPETAGILGITEAALEARLRRARLVLRAAIAAASGESLPQAFAFVAPRCRRVMAGVMTAIERTAISREASGDGGPCLDEPD